MTGTFPEKAILDKFNKLSNEKSASQTPAPPKQPLPQQLEKECQYIEANLQARKIKSPSSIARPTNWSAVRKGLFAFLLIAISFFIIFQLGNAHFDLLHPAKMISTITHES